MKYSRFAKRCTPHDRVGWTLNLHSRRPIGLVEWVWSRLCIFKLYSEGSCTITVPDHHDLKHAKIWMWWYIPGGGFLGTKIETQLCFDFGQNQVAYVSWFGPISKFNCILIWALRRVRWGPSGPPGPFFWTTRAPKGAHLGAVVDPIIWSLAYTFLVYNNLHECIAMCKILQISVTINRRSNSRCLKDTLTQRVQP